MPWYLPLAALIAWLAVRPALQLRAEGGPGRITGKWILILAFLPLLYWLAVQFKGRLGCLL